MISDLDTRDNTLELFKENVGKDLSDLEFSKDF